MPKGIYKRTEKNTTKSRTIHASAEYKLKVSIAAKQGIANMTPEARRIWINNMIAKRRSPEGRDKSRISHMKAWENNEEYKNNLSIGVKEGLENMSQEAKKQMWLGHSISLKGRTLPKEQIEKIRKHHNTPEYKLRNLQMLKEYWSNPTILDARSYTSKRLWKEPSYVSIQMKSRGCRPNKAEFQLEKILNNHFPNEWAYVGDGQLIIGGRCPDFTNINGKKELIELFGNYWHKDENPQNKIDFYKNYGFNCLVIWENELKDENTLIKKITFYNREMNV